MREKLEKAEERYNSLIISNNEDETNKAYNYVTRLRSELADVKATQRQQQQQQQEEQKVYNKLE